MKTRSPRGSAGSLSPGSGNEGSSMRCALLAAECCYWHVHSSTVSYSSACSLVHVGDRDGSLYVGWSWMSDISGISLSSTTACFSSSDESVSSSSSASQTRPCNVGHHWQPGHWGGLECSGYCSHSCVAFSVNYVCMVYDVPHDDAPYSAAE